MQETTASDSSSPTSIGGEHSDEPDFLVRLDIPERNVTVVLAIKGYEDNLTLAKHTAAST